MTARVLIADDDRANTKLLEEICTSLGYRVLRASDGEEALAVARAQRPDLILLDVVMPKRDGFDVIRELRADVDLSDVAILIVTAAGDSDLRAKGVELGADDYVSKPFRVFEIQQRIRNALRLRSAERALARRGNVDPVDPLTRAGTSQQLLVTISYEFARATRYGKALTCFVVRLANFDEIAKLHGFETVEGVVAQLANGLRSCVRGVDHLFRSDVDEFTVLLPETDRQGAEVVLGRIRAGASDASLFRAPISPLPDLRIGVAALPDADLTTADRMLRAALDATRR